MDLLTLLGTALALALDAFAVAAAVAATVPEASFRHAFRLAWHFGLFQFFMPVLGWWGGSMVARYLSAVDHWIAFGLLWFIGVRMIRGSLDPKEDCAETRDPTRGWSLVGLAVATSIDALAVGLSLALLRVSIWFPSVVIGVVALALTAVGFALGRSIGHRLGQWAERVGGAVLMLVGARILVQHLLG